MDRLRRCEDTRQHSVSCFVKKQVGLGFSSFASKLAEEQWRVVHVASLWRSRGSEVKDNWFDDDWRGVNSSCLPPSDSLLGPSIGF
jgi:hypothetical protein